MRRLVLLLVVLTLAACGTNPEEIAELNKQQRQILAKLSDLEKKVDKIAERPAAPAAAARKPAPDPNKVYDLPVESSPIRGPKDAPVTIVEFSDYQCPFCARAEPLISEVLGSYPEKVRFVYKNFPLTGIHPFALGATKAAIAAGQQGKYWEMHDKLFANNRKLASEDLKKYAEEIGLDVQKWEKDMASTEVRKVVAEEMKQASAAEVRGTPTFFVNGKRVSNRSVEGFKSMIEDALKEKKTS